MRRVKENRRKPFQLAKYAYFSAVGLLIGSFALQVLFFSFNIREGLMPEENYHLSLLYLQSHNDGLFLRNSPETLYLGNIEGQPFLYNLIFGNLLRLNDYLPIQDYSFLKLIHIFLALGTVMLAFSLFRAVTSNRVIHLLALGIMTHLLGFVFYASAIHPFTFFTFLITGEIAFMLWFFQQKKARFLCLFLLCFFAAPLVSPIGLMVDVIMILLLLMHFTRLGHEFSKILYWRWRFIPAILCFLVGYATNAAFYGGNLITYGNLVPECHDILTMEQCMNGRFLFRDEVEKYAFQKNSETNLHPTAYFREWGSLVNSRLTGISAFQKYCKNQEAEACGFFKGEFFWHETRIFQEPVVTAAIKGIILFTLLGMGMMGFLSFKKFNTSVINLENRLIFYLAAIALFYLFVIFWMDYGSYQGSGGHVAFAFHEYHLFPVIALIAFIVAFFTICYLPVRTQPLVCGLCILLFFWSSIPAFLSHQKSGELLAKKDNIVSLLKCDELYGFCSIENNADWKYCVPDQDWQCLSSVIGVDMMR